jgi:uncharacterized membrane protein YhaH (DUF805 family)
MTEVADDDLSGSRAWPGSVLYLEGRASRSEYWGFILFCVLCYALGLLLTAKLQFPVVPFVWLGLVMPTLGVGVRRLHDTNRSGAWWFMVFAPFGTIVLIVFFCIHGDPGPNRYGPPPVMSADPRTAAGSQPWDRC